MSCSLEDGRDKKESFLMDRKGKTLPLKVLLSHYALTRIRSHAQPLPDRGTEHFSKV
jgi:hypothetical protein